MKKRVNPTIGVIGQGFVGKNLADEFENRHFSVVRYAREARYKKNKERISTCDIVFIAVPTPTTPAGSDDSIVRGVIPLVGGGKIAVIKSTVLPGTTERLAREFPDRFILHAPEFLTEAKAAYDVAHPTRAIVGVPIKTRAYRESATRVLGVLPKSPAIFVCSAWEAEFVKFAANCFLASKVVFANVLYDAVLRVGHDWKLISAALTADPRIGPSHFAPRDRTGGRGAGGHCFIKDLAAFRRWYDTEGYDRLAAAVLAAIEEKNKDLLVRSRKDLSLVRGVYGS